MRERGGRKPGLPLEGIRILDLSRIWAGPYATRLLADMGAQVVKVESARFMDSVRGISGTAHGLPPEQGNPWNCNGWFNILHVNKLGITLELSHPRGRELFQRLVNISDVIIENFRYGTLERLGFGYQALRGIRPDIIYISMPSFGNSGPWRNFIQYGVGQEQLAGMSSFTGYEGGPPMRLGVNHGDPVTGAHAAGAVMAALIYRRRTGKGMFIDLSHLESAVCLMGEYLLAYQMNRQEPQRMGNGHPWMAPHGAYPCQGEDHWITIAVASDREWRGLCRAMGRPELARDPRFADALGRWRHRRELDPLIGAWTREQDWHQATRLLQRQGVAAFPVLSARDLLEDPHYRERGMFQPLAHREMGTHPYPGVAWKMSRRPGRLRWAAPCLGEHNHQVLTQLLGMEEEETEELERQGVIGIEPTGEAEA